MLTLIYLSVYLDIDPVKSFPLKQATKTIAEQLGKLIETNSSGSSGFFSSSGRQHGSVSSYGSSFLKDLFKGGLSTSDIAWYQVLPTAVATVPTHGAAVSLLLFYPFPSVQQRPCTNLPHSLPKP